MRDNINNKYDAIIIGAGISGLICGCYLAKSGLKVLIIEQHNKPGGYCTSFKRKGFIFDAAAHSFGSYKENGSFWSIHIFLEIDEILNIKRYDPSDIVISPDYQIVFHNNLEETTFNLIKQFPTEKQGILDFITFITKLDKIETAKLKNKTFLDILNSYISDIKLKSLLSTTILGNGGLPPSLLHAFTGVKIFLEFLIDGGYYPGDCMQSLPESLVLSLKNYNGQIIFNNIVKKILVKNNIAIGVELENKVKIFSQFIVSACDIKQTYFNLLNKNKIVNTKIKKIATMIPSISTFILYLGIDKYFKGLPPEGSNVWYLPYYDLDKYFYYINQCEFNKAGGFMLRVSPSKKTLIAFFLAPFISKLYWKKNKKAVCQDFLNRIASWIPDIKSHIIYVEAATPYTLLRYTNNYQGANYGWAPTVSQLFDPDFKQKSEIKGLYFTGHWTCQTHGIPGTAYLGYNTAKLILKNFI